MTGANDTVDIPPFVDDETDEEGKDQAKGADTGGEAVEGNSPEGIQAENELQSSGSDDIDDSEDTKDSDGSSMDLLLKIEDIVLEGLKDYLSSETKDVDTTDDESDGEDTERTSAMSYGDRKTATGIDGKPIPAVTPDKVLETVEHTGIDYATEVEKNRQKNQNDVPDSSLVGDNVGGSQINPGDIDPTNTAVSTPEDDEPGSASVASVAKLVDQFIKAGVYSDTERWDRVEELSHMSASAVRNQSTAIAKAMDGFERRSAQMAEAALRSAQMNKKFAEDSSDEDNDLQDDTLVDETAEDTKDDKNTEDTKDDKNTEEKTSALIDRFGVAKATVAHKGKRFAWVAGSESGIESTMSKAVIAASKAIGSRLDVASEVAIARASERRKAAKRQAETKAAHVRRSGNGDLQAERERRRAALRGMRTPKMAHRGTDGAGLFL